MTTKEQIEIIQAYERGEVIEWKSINVTEWSSLPSKEQFKESGYYEPKFDFVHNNYRIKPKRWRAEFDGAYYFVGAVGVEPCYETHCDIDNGRYELGNYFHTQEQAEKARKLLKECLTKFHTENE